MKKAVKARVLSHKQIDQLVGVWYVIIEDAPFQHHYFTFHADGTMLQTNPDAGNADTSDGVGMGIWKKNGAKNKIIGKFEEINADRRTHKFISNARISFEMIVAKDTFVGSAHVIYYDKNDKKIRGPLTSSLKGRKIHI